MIVYMKLIIFYLITILTGLLIFSGINHYGSGLFPGGPATVIPVEGNQMSLLASVLLALVTIIIIARAFGHIFERINQPAVMGEVVGGIFLGPSVLGFFFPEVTAQLLPAVTLPYLNIISQIGILLYMFIVGLELNLKELRKSAHSTFIISHASILVPFVLGSAFAIYFFKEMATPGISFTNFALFFGVSMSVTAFPVLARILADKGLTKTPMGSLALTCAAIDDVTAWCLLAIVVSSVQSTPGNGLMTFLYMILYIMFMLLFVKPVLKKWLKKSNNKETFTTNKLAVFLIAVLLSALATELAGIHAIFGAFFLGLITPHESFAAHDLNDKLKDVVRILFLPAFFAYTGMKTQIGLLTTPSDWLLCLMIITIAVVGKLGGTFFAARLVKHSWKDSLVLGILMNTRGLVELIVLNIGLELGIITPRLFAMLVIMALVTTFMAGPLLSFFQKRST